MAQLVHFITNHWVLWLAFVVVVLLILLNEIITKNRQAKNISHAEAIDKMNHENATIIDIRDKEIFLKGHIIDAIQCNTDDFTQNRMDKYKTKPIILVCARGLQSQTLATKLQSLGFTQPMSLAGGMEGWLAAELPIVKGKTSTSKMKRSD